MTTSIWPSALIFMLRTGTRAATTALRAAVTSRWRKVQRARPILSLTEIEGLALLVEPHAKGDTRCVRVELELAIVVGLALGALTGAVFFFHLLAV